ncbi:hypothetical protein [Streptomyces prunicolor]|uniref:hypothetical protein n=1 Tax=Streptomyces prunicolor TaxID=67348 RepID=UPI0003776EE9|nr:hypothetical protein [Streptomyces prunicolor]
MNTGQGWEKRALHALVLLLAVAYGIRWAYELVRPVVPFIIGGAVVVALVWAVLEIRQRRRW